MTQHMSPSRIIQLTLTAAVLLPITAFAETPMTARQMLAHAQSQAVNVPDEVKKPEPDKNDRMSGEAVVTPTGASAVARPLPVIEPPAPISPQPTTLSALTVPVARPEPASPQTRTNSLTAAAPSVDPVKAHAAPATPSVATAAGSTPSVAPTTPPVAAAASPAAAPAVGPAAATAQPSVPTTIAARTQEVQAVAPLSSSAARPADARRPSKAAAPPSRIVHKSSPRSSLRNDDAAIGTRISNIMRRPEVQALMSQYGLE
ncbi:hypothetical protein HL667_05725 [Bradyrhizobium sp. 83012]|uniref:Uncharacterized protein n=1 Tax=Bradyrhizobium aeschynomenes TaxID=2734909 RepID=A0ABX2CAV0_9BRAD|nr:hypothetical protein [Bradyrhizobium aeschynomenes]NPU64492.1 hypothetical protein [Bradyrhizobium aeschynomenes]